MAPGRIADGFLATFARAAGAGVIPVLAAVAFALAGCGGGSSGDSGSIPASSQASGPQGGAEVRQAPSAPSDSSAHGNEPPADTGRHGPPVPMPSGEEEHKITPQQRREATVANITLESPSSPPGARGTSALSAKYTCDGANTSPALRWQGVPSGTRELALFAMNLQPVEGKLFFDWAVAGLDPELEEIKAGTLPAGAIVGRNSFGKVGYEICPAGAGETYMFALFALPKELSPAHGFDPFALRKAVAGVSGSAGLLGMSYARG